MPKFITDTLCKKYINSIAKMVARQTLKSVEDKIAIMIGEKTFADLTELRKIGISKIPVIGQAIESLDLLYIGYIIYKLFALIKKLYNRNMEIEKRIEDLKNKVEGILESDPLKSLYLCFEFILEHKNEASQHLKIMKVVFNLQILINRQIQKIRAKDDDSSAAFFLKYILFTRLNPTYISSKNESILYEDVENCLKNIHSELKSDPEKFCKESTLFLKIFENLYIEKLNKIIGKMIQICNFFEEKWSCGDITAENGTIDILVEKIQVIFYKNRRIRYPNLNIITGVRKFKNKLKKFYESLKGLISGIKYLENDLRLTKKLITFTINIKMGDYNHNFEKNKSLYIDMTHRLIQDMINFINRSANKLDFNPYEKILNHDVRNHIYEILDYIDDRRLDEYLENEYSEDQFSDY